MMQVTTLHSESYWASASVTRKREALMNAIAVGYAAETGRGWIGRFRNVSRRTLLAIGVATVALGTAAYGYEWATVGRFIETTDDAYVGGDVTAIAPHVAGLVSEIAANDNEHVPKGQRLLRLDNRDFPG